MKLNLTKNLKETGYDLIDGITRNHKPLQLWNLRMGDEVDFFADKISDVFKSDVTLNELKNDALSTVSNQKDEFNINMGASALDLVLEAFGLGKMDLSSNLKITKSVSIGFSDTYSLEYTRHNLDRYLNHDSIDFSGNIPDFYIQLRRDNFYLITGVIYAKGLEINIETSANISAAIEAKFIELIDGKIEFSKSSENQIKLVSQTDNPIPIAVKVHRLRYQGENFRRMELVSDKKSIF